MAVKENDQDLVKAFKDCKSRAFKFHCYERKCFQPDDFLMSNILNSGMNKMPRALRPNLFTNELDRVIQLTESEEFERIVADDFERLVNAKGVLHEALFLINRQKKTANDDDEDITNKYANVPTMRANDIKRAFEKTWNRVEENDIKDLRGLQENRDKFLEELPLNEDWWMKQIWNGYCEGLIYSCALLSNNKLEKETVIKMIEKYTSANASEGSKADKKTVDSLIQGYAFMIDSLSKEQTIDIQFIKKIHNEAYELNDGNGGIIMMHYDRLKGLLAWLQSHFISADYDPLTLASIAHYGIIFLRPFNNANHRTARILQDYILMSFGYPPACIFDQELKNYIQLEWESKRFEGVDLRPFIRFISANCMSNTLKVFLKKSDQIELASTSEKIATTSKTEAKQKRERDEIDDIDLNESQSTGSSAEKEFSPKKMRIDSTADLDEDESPEIEQPRVGSPNKSLQFKPSPLGSFQSLQPSSFSSSNNSGKSQSDGKRQLPLSNQSSLDSNFAMEEAEKTEERKEDKGTICPNPLAIIFKQALRAYNPALVEYIPSEIPEEPTVLLYNGWAEIFKYVLRAHNSELLNVK